jgi:tetratricopeptide (TPR) repeat protein
MKSKVLLLVSSILISTAALAQKEELKTLKKIYGREKTSDSDMADYKATLSKAESLVANSTEDDKVYFAFYKAMSPVLEMNLVMSKPENLNNPVLILKYLTVDNVSQLVTNLNATLDYEKKSGKQVYTKDIEETITSFKPMIVNFAIALANNSNYKDAAVVLHAIYELDKKDVEKLYYSANYAVNSKDYDLSLKYYQELKALNYTGADMAYYAINKETKKEDSFNTKAERDIYLKANSHEKPRDEKLPSKRPEIFKNIALIYVELGKSAEAKAAIKEARIENPEDVALILTEADLFLKEKDMVSYKKLIVEALEKNPNDAILVFNLGVVSYNNKELVDAEKYYVKAIELDPKYVDAYLNLAILKLDAEKSLIEKMNKLGTSAPEMKKYDVLKKQREDVYKSAIPYLKKVTELSPDNVEAIKTLIGVYNALEMFDEAKVLKAQLKK